MKRPRLTIGDAMIAIVLISANCVALRWMTVSEPIATIVLVVLLPANLLLFGLVRIGYRLARTRSAEPFAVALQVLGWPATFALGAATLAGLVGGYGGEWLDRYLGVARVPAVFFLRAIGIESLIDALPGRWGWVAADVAFFLLVFGVPLSALCLVGSLSIRALARRLGRRRVPGVAA